MNKPEILLIKKCLDVIQKLSKVNINENINKIEELINESILLTSNKNWDISHLKEDVEKYPGEGSRFEKEKLGPTGVCGTYMTDYSLPKNKRFAIRHKGSLQLLKIKDNILGFFNLNESKIYCEEVDILVKTMLLGQGWEKFYKDQYTDIVSPNNPFFGYPLCTSFEIVSLEDTRIVIPSIGPTGSCGNNS